MSTVGSCRQTAVCKPVQSREWRLEDGPPTTPFQPWHQGACNYPLNRPTAREALKIKPATGTPEMRKETGGLLPSWRFLPCCINGVASARSGGLTAKAHLRNPAVLRARTPAPCFLNGASQAYPLSRCTNLWITQFTDRPVPGFLLLCSGLPNSVGSRRLVDRSRCGKQPMREAGRRVARIAHASHQKTICLCAGEA